jgi:hypothetical protein
MATWTPTDLTNPEFVQTQLTPLDRSNALLTMNNNITGVQSALERNQAALAAAQELTNGPLSFGTVRDARQAAQAAQTAGAANAAELQIRYEELQAQRSIQTANADRFLRSVQQGEEALRTAQLAVNNLERAGAVPPGTNQFAPPPGYTATINPPQEVPDSQNPTNTPAETNENLQNPAPISIDENLFDGIDEQVAANENTLQEPPLLSDEEIEQQLALAAAQEETITSPDSITENVFDPRQEVTENVFDPRQDVQENVFDPTSNNGASQGLTGPKTNTQSQATQQDTANFYQTGDWRVRLSLAPSANYLYKAKGNEGILLPLAATNGVLFPYTPNISVSYAAHYDPSDITHSNYKTFQYKSSSVDSFTISCDFTAQDTFEANYLLAVIHFFRSVTKMFYGQDENPKNGTPPPLCYLTGLGAFQFDRHPLAITSFNYTLPTEVDYIRATNTTTTGGVNKSPGNTPVNTTDVPSQRLGSLPAGGGSGPVNWQNTNSGSREPTYVPTKMQIQITAVPIVTRNDISRNFSLKDYATGELLRGSKRKQGGGGIW